MDLKQDYLKRFESKLIDDMLRLCTTCQKLEGVLLHSEDIDAQWKILGPEYLADAVGQIKDYPTVSVAWAGYLGMAVAYGWDLSWDVMKKYNYQAFYGEQGYDDMDEHIVRDILKISLDSPEAKDLEVVIRRAAEMAVDHIRHEQIEPQSPMAYYVFERACQVMYRIGAAIELKSLGYKFEKIQ